MSQTTTDIPEQRCAKCGFLFSQTTNPSVDVKPFPGAVSICIACGAVQIFNTDFTLRDPTPEERGRLQRDPIVTELQLARAYLFGDKFKRGRRCGSGHKPSGRQ